MIDPALIEKVHEALPEDVTGWCYAASETLYYLAGGKEAGLKPCQGQVGDTSHWWLQDEDGTIYDLTAAQFDFVWPYEEGTGRGFMPKRKQATTNLLRVIGIEV
jgi:hypothetical protein